MDKTTAILLALMAFGPDMIDDTDLRIKHLGELFRRDQRQFEQERSRLIHETIERYGAEHRKQAYGLQFRIDCLLRPYRDPVMRMNKMVEIFWQGVLDFQDTLNDPGRRIARRQQRLPGKILPIKRDDAGKEDA